MSDTEPKSESSKNGEQSALAIEALGYAQDLLMDEDPDVERPDLWTITWDELQKPVDGYVDDSTERTRQMAYNQMQSLYADSLEVLYPQLKDVKSTDEMMMEMLSIGDLPECSGYFTCSGYRAENGNIRTMAYTEVHLGNKTAMDLYISDADAELNKTYGIRLSVDMTLSGSSEVFYRGNEHVEDEMVEKIHPTQANNLMRVLNAAMADYEMEQKLSEIRLMSEEMLDPDELDQIIEFARKRFFEVLEQKVEKILSGLYEISASDLKELLAILSERSEQLDL